MKADQDRCPSVVILELLLTEQLSEAELDPVETHVEGCAACQEQLEGMIAPATVAAAVVPAGANEAEMQPHHDFLRRLKELPPPGPVDSEFEMAPTQRQLFEEPPAPDRAADLKKKRLGQYEILETLGKGNMGVVYKARHIELGKLVALKVLPASMLDEVNIVRFKNEARMASRLDHLNIVATHDAGRAEDMHFLVMAFVDGIDLASLVQRHGRLAVPDACEVIRQAAIGLQHAFERGLVHRDIKPSNMMLTRDGVVKVLDFGIARSFADTVAAERLTATGMLLGTADYLAPEQWENPHAVDTRADIYSLGCTLYHLIAGHPPFFGPRYQSVLTKMRGHLEAAPPSIQDERPDAPAELVAVLEQMLAKEPEDRYATPGELVAALQLFSAGADLRVLLTQTAPDATNPTPVLPFDTAQPSRTLASNRPARRLAKRFALALSLASVWLAVVISVALWFRQSNPSLATPPLKIEAMTVSQFRDITATPHGDIARTLEPIFTDDSVRVSARLSVPAYFFLIAFNPDGTEQLCYPEDPERPAVQYPRDQDAKSMTMAPARSADLRYPQDQYFEPGIPGLQVFVLIVSAEPLPPYAEWRSRLSTIPWKSRDADGRQLRWEFDGQEISVLSGERGSVVERGPRHAAPSEFRELCDFFRSRPEKVRAIAFPVTRK
jgi:serine/threonine protein kinase